VDRIVVASYLVRYPLEWYHMDRTIATHLPLLRPAQQRGLALWVYATLCAQSATQSAVLTALVACAQPVAMHYLWRDREQLQAGLRPVRLQCPSAAAGTHDISCLNCTAPVTVQICVCL